MDSEDLEFVGLPKEATSTHYGSHTSGQHLQVASVVHGLLEDVESMLESQDAPEPMFAQLRDIKKQVHGLWTADSKGTLETLIQTLESSPSVVGNLLLTAASKRYLGEESHPKAIGFLRTLCL